MFRKLFVLISRLVFPLALSIFNTFLDYFFSVIILIESPSSIFNIYLLTVLVLFRSIFGISSTTTLLWRGTGIYFRKCFLLSLLTVGLPINTTQVILANLSAMLRCQKPKITSLTLALDFTEELLRYFMGIKESNIINLCLVYPLLFEFSRQVLHTFIFVKLVPKEELPRIKVKETLAELREL